MSEKSLFLGNGFNICLGVNTSYKVIYESMQKKNFLKKLLPDEEEMQVKGYNLEEIFRKSEDAQYQTLQYHLFEEIINKCKTTISAHTKLMEFLSGNFVNFFTTNYDPLLYHNLLLLKESKFEEDEKFTEALEGICYAEVEKFQLIKLPKKQIYAIAKKIFNSKSSFSKKKPLDYMETLKIIKKEQTNLKITDGFYINSLKGGKKTDKYKVWDKYRSAKEQNIFYLHGALHIYKEESDIRKYISNRRRVSFINEIQKHSEDNFSSLSCVFHHKSEDKLKKINSNLYLKNCLKKLSSLKGELTIIGWSANENDRHLIDAINSAEGIKRVIFYYHGEEAPSREAIGIKHWVDFKCSADLPFAKKVKARNYDAPLT